jgi:hypothetical protein
MLSDGEKSIRLQTFFYRCIILTDPRIKNVMKQCFTINYDSRQPLPPQIADAIRRKKVVHLESE